MTSQVVCRLVAQARGHPPGEDRGKDDDLANPLRVGPAEDAGISGWSLKVNDPPELPIAWLVGGRQPFVVSGLALGRASG